MAAWTLTSTWQFARLPTAARYWRATPTDALPHLANDTSSITHTSGRMASHNHSAIRRLTGNGSHGDRFTNCRRACMFPSGRRSAIGWTDLRRPSSIKPRRQHSPRSRSTSPQPLQEAVHDQPRSDLDVELRHLGPKAPDRIGPHPRTLLAALERGLENPSLTAGQEHLCVLVGVGEERTSRLVEALTAEGVGRPRRPA